MKKIYIAGFDVFSEDAVKIGQENKKICEKYGFTGLYPLDNECADAKEIFKANTGMIDRADIVAANLNDFRGSTMDDGTAFEIGYAFAKGKQIYGYMDDTRTLKARFGDRDPDGFYYEDFGLPVNLMIAECTAIVEGGFEDCIREIAGQPAESENNRKEQIV